MQVELIPYAEREELDQALINKEVHAICIRSTPDNASSDFPNNFSYQTQVRLPRLYEIIKNELDDSAATLTQLTYVNPALDTNSNSSPNSDNQVLKIATKPANSGETGETR